MVRRPKEGLDLALEAAQQEARTLLLSLAPAQCLVNCGNNTCHMNDYIDQ